MDTVTAALIAEGVIEPASHEQYVEAWQVLIDSGVAWSLQGWFGRTAKELIDMGVCQPQKKERAPVDSAV